MNIKRLVALGTAGVLTMGVLAACDDDDDNDNDNPGVTTTAPGGTVTSDAGGGAPGETGVTTP